MALIQHGLTTICPNPTWTHTSRQILHISLRHFDKGLMYSLLKSSQKNKELRTPLAERTSHTTSLKNINHNSPFTFPKMGWRQARKHTHTHIQYKQQDNYPPCHHLTTLMHLHDLQSPKAGYPVPYRSTNEVVVTQTPLIRRNNSSLYSPSFFKPSTVMILLKDTISIAINANDAHSNND